jgi:hypothetical protein
MQPLTPKEAAYVEGYAAALQDVMQELTGSNTCDKSYDPLTVELQGTLMRSYAYDMKDGGREHPVSDYDSIEDICKTLSSEVLCEIACDLDIVVKTLSPLYVKYGEHD